MHRLGISEWATSLDIGLRNSFRFNTLKNLEIQLFSSKIRSFEPQCALNGLITCIKFRIFPIECERDRLSGEGELWNLFPTSSHQKLHMLHLF